MIMTRNGKKAGSYQWPDTSLGVIIGNNQVGLSIFRGKGIGGHGWLVMLVLLSYRPGTTSVVGSMARHYPKYIL